MINLTSTLCKELDLTYWQLNQDQMQTSHTITRDEKELLRKILIAKAVKLNDSFLEILGDGVVVINLAKVKLTFNGSKLTDTETHINLPKLSDMLINSHYKKEAWFKLKDKQLL